MSNSASADVVSAEWFLLLQQPKWFSAERIVLLHVQKWFRLGELYFCSSRNGFGWVNCISAAAGMVLTE